MAINAALPIEDAHGDGIATYFWFRINLLLRLSFDQAKLLLKFLYFVYIPAQCRYNEIAQKIFKYSDIRYIHHSYSG